MLRKYDCVDQKWCNVGAKPGDQERGNWKPGPWRPSARQARQDRLPNILINLYIISYIIYYYNMTSSGVYIHSTSYLHTKMRNVFLNNRLFTIYSLSINNWCIYIYWLIYHSFIIWLTFDSFWLIWIDLKHYYYFV